MANEDKKTNASEIKQSNYCSVMVNIVALIVVIAVSFAAGFGVCNIIRDNLSKDERPDLNHLHQMRDQNNTNRQSPNNNNRNNLPSRPDKENSNSNKQDSSSQS